MEKEAAVDAHTGVAPFPSTAPELNAALDPEATIHAVRRGALLPGCAQLESHRILPTSESD